MHLGIPIGIAFRNAFADGGEVNHCLPERQSRDLALNPQRIASGFLDFARNDNESMNDTL
jgi:hypothetical protein